MIDLATSQQQAVDQRQEQSLTQQQIQAVEMLAAPLMELHAYVTAELQANPLLEADFPDQGITADAEEQPAPVDQNDDEWISRLVELGGPLYRGAGEAHGTSAEEEERRQHVINSIAAQTTLEEVLLAQIRFLALEPRLFACCELIVTALSEDGYLTMHPADLAMVLNLPLEDVREAIRIVQSCDPAGVAVADLRERLLLQLERRGERDTLAYRLVSERLEDLGANRVPTMARSLGVSVEAIRDAMHLIQDLRPRLDHEADADDTVEVQPEIEIVEERNGNLEVRMHDLGIPRLRISSQYRSLLTDPGATEETKAYVKDKIRSAAFLINCIAQRQSTLERIARAIVAAQEDFFRAGLECMRPLTMAEVADAIGVHETTVSRGVSGKYLTCKHGTMPLRRFFSNGYSDDQGNSISNLVVKNTVRDLISSEDRRRPLSDGQISTLLHRKGLRVARRTVAKYRETMGLMPAKLRRQYW